MREITRTGENSISLILDGPHITAGIFLAALENMFGIMKDVSISVVDKKNAVRWIISVESGSNRINALAEAVDVPPEEISIIISSIHDGLSSLEKRAERPSHFSDSALRKAQNLASVLDAKGDYVDKLQITSDKRRLQLSHRTVTHVQELLEIKSEAFGSIEGWLHMMTDRGGLKFSIDDVLANQAITCHIDEELREKFAIAFAKKQRVLISGLIKYRAGGVPASISKIDNFIIIEKKNLPTFYDVKGIFRR